LAHAKRTVAQRAFLGADFVTGAAYLVPQTIVGAASNVGVSPAAVHAALQQGPNRAAIEADQLSLFPAPRSALLAGKSAQEKLAEVVDEIGPDATYDLLAQLRWLGFNVAVGNDNAAATNEAA
jgi:hypothetical protein